MLRPINLRAGARRQRGTSMVEVLVAIVIVVVGLLGMAGLQSRASMAELEAFQRAQAVVLLQDMVDRINANRQNALSYATAAPMGTERQEVDCAPMNIIAHRDLCEWNNQLLGAAELKSGNKVGAMGDARGCVFVVNNTMPMELQVVVSWQGSVQTKEPGNECGRGKYGADGFRRSLTASVTLGCLQNTNALTTTCITTPLPAVPTPF